MNYSAGELTRLLLATKTKIAASVPAAGQMAAPSTDRDAVLPAHPGTIAFLNGDAPSLLDEAMNYITIGTMLMGAFGALAAWVTSLRNRRQLRELKQSVQRLPALLDDIRQKPAAGLDSTQSELDRLSEWFVEKYVTDEISSDVFNSAVARVGHLRDLINKRRQETSVSEEAKSDAGSETPRELPEKADLGAKRL
jgi:hypothetical protein